MSTYQEKLVEPGVMDIIDENQQKFEPYAAMVDKAYENLHLEFVNNQDAHGQIKNDETGEAIYILRIQSQLNKIPKFMSQFWHQEISYQR